MDPLGIEVNEELKEVYEFERATKLDKYALDDECADQSRLVFDFSKLASILNSEMDDCERKMNLRKAKLSMDIRKNPGLYGISKITDSVLIDVALLDDEYQELHVRFLALKRKYGIAKAAVKSMDHKSSSLDNEIKLFLRNYYAEPEEGKMMEKYKEVRSGEKHMEQLNSNERLRDRSNRGDR